MGRVLQKLLSLRLHWIHTVPKCIEFPNSAFPLVWRTLKWTIQYKQTREVAHVRLERAVLYRKEQDDRHHDPHQLLQPGKMVCL